MELPRLNRHFLLFFHSDDFAREFLAELKKKYGNLTMYANQSKTCFSYKLSETEHITCFKAPYRSCCGVRADIVFIEDGISSSILEEIVIPAACIGEASMWIYKKNKWERYKPKQEQWEYKDAVKEAETWLASLDEE